MKINNIITYRVFKFFNLLYESGILPVNGLLDKSLYN